MISVQNLEKKYEQKIALNSISFEIPRGEICGYIGPNGAGKSTTVKILTGMLTPEAGTISIKGIDVREKPDLIKPMIGYVPETGAVYESLTPMEYLQLVGRLHELEDALIEERSNMFLEYFELLPVANSMMTTYSKGMRQKVVIIASLIHAPEILFFDEPLHGLDANATVLFKELVRNLARRGKTILYCSHLLDIVERICDRIIILRKGNIIAQGTFEEIRTLTKQETLEEAFSFLTDTNNVEERTLKLLEAFEKTIPA